MAWEKCFGEICKSVSYSLKSLDIDNLTYVYRPPPGGGPQSTGTLDKENVAYRTAWAASLIFFRLTLPPFTGLAPKCDNGCKCVLGAPATETQTHTYTTTFRLPSRAEITITGNFDVEVTVRVGVCTPAPGTVFKLAGREQEAFGGLIAGFIGDPGKPKGGKRKG